MITVCLQTGASEPLLSCFVGTLYARDATQHEGPP